MQIIVDGKEITADGVTENGIPNGYSYIMSFAKDEEKLLAKWTRYPLSFCQEALGINEKNGLTVSPQQKQAFTALGDLCYAKKILWDNKQSMERVARQVKAFARLTGLSVRAGKGIGKTGFEAFVIIWFLFTHRNAKVPIIGPTEQHLRTILLAEVHKWLQFRNNKGEFVVAQVVRDCIQADTEKIYFKDKDLPDSSWGKQWFAFMKVVAKNADKEVTKGILSGIHEDNVLVVFDEAAAIAQDEVFEPLENTLTGRCNLCLMTFNPNRNTGYARDTHLHPTISKQWKTLHWNAEDAPEWIVSKEHIAKMEERYGGRDTNNYRVNVLGDFPTADDGSLIPYLWVHRALEADLGEVPKDTPVVMGIDVARDGGDQTVICIRHGYKVLAFHRVNLIDSDDVALEAVRFARKYDVETIFVDSIGVGAGVFDRLRHHWPKTVSVKVSEAARDTRKFMRMRDELWWRARERFESGNISIPNIIPLVEQLTSVQYDDQTAGGKIKVEGKNSMRKRLGGESPDYADALNLTFYHSEDLWRKKPEKPDAWRRMDLEESIHQRSWMSV